MKIAVKPTTLYLVSKGSTFLGCMFSLKVATTLKLDHPGANIEPRKLSAPTYGCVAGLLLSRTGGASKGGLARSKTLSAKRRKEIAAKANAARWAKTKVIK